jgi:hypothetical protein
MILIKRIDHNYLKYLFTVAISTLMVTGYGQQVEKQQIEKQQLDEYQIKTVDSIDVVRDYRPVLADAVKEPRYESYQSGSH